MKLETLRDFQIAREAGGVVVIIDQPTSTRRAHDAEWASVTE